MMAANDLDVVAMIGLMFPRGIVGKNAIMMIDLACSARRDASYQARCLLLRAITTMAAILGMLAPILGAGICPELCRLLGLAIVRQVLPLFTTPYFYFDRIVTGLNPLAGGPFE
jgi:multidrug efflux pump